MRRLVIDTNLHIDWLNAGQHEDQLFQRDATTYLSAVVILELYAGAFSPRERRILRSVVTAFERANRVLVPSGAIDEEAGHVLRTLQASRGYRLARTPALVHRHPRPDLEVGRRQPDGLVAGQHANDAAAALWLKQHRDRRLRPHVTQEPEPRNDPVVQVDQLRLGQLVDAAPGGFSSIPALATS